MTGRARADDVAVAYLRDQADAVQRGATALRAGDGHPIHDTRVAVRRLRTVLRVFGPVLDVPARAELEDDLSWYQDLLGTERDVEVQRERLTSALGELPADLVLGHVEARLADLLDNTRSTAHTALLDALGTQRYERLSDRVAGLADGVRATGGTKRMLKLTRSAGHEAAKRLRAAVSGTDDELLHRARRASKRARYAAEFVQPLDGRFAAKAIRRHKRVQSVLGEHQDAVVASDLLRRLARPAIRSGENGFTLGVLHEQQQAIMRTTRRTAARLAR